MASLVPADPPTGSLSHVKINLASKPDRNGVGIGFNGIDGNRPATFANYLALWDTTGPIIGIDTPIATAQIALNLQPGTVHIDYPRFSHGDYLVTYQVGPSLKAMCANLVIRTRLPLLSAGPTSSVLRLLSAEATRVRLMYDTIAGYRPQQYGNWIGIWPGNPIVYAPGNPPLGHATFTSNATQGVITIDGLKLNPLLTYTVAYFSSGAATLAPGHDVAAVLRLKAI